jgi:hypothetical protein
MKSWLAHALGAAFLSKPLTQQALAEFLAVVEVRQASSRHPSAALNCSPSGAASLPSSSG